MKTKDFNYKIVPLIRVLLLALLLLGLPDDLLAIPGSCSPAFPPNVTKAAADTIPLLGLTVGVEIRTRYEKYWNDNWGAALKDDNGYILHRLLFFTIIPIGQRVRILAELKSALHSNLDIPPRPVDEDKLDLQKLSVEIILGNSFKKSGLVITMGRQELELGSKRLINKREYTNALLSFDGLSFIAKKNNFSLTAFGLRQSKMAFGVFDNWPDPDRNLWGAMVTRSVPGKRFGNLDVYYIGFSRKQISNNIKDFVNFYDEGPYQDNRHSFGIRLFGASKRIDYDVETIYQAGEYSRNGSRIRAWRTAASLGDTVAWKRLKIRCYVNADLSSGDQDSTDKVINTFVSPYPDILDPTASNLSGFRAGVGFFLGSAVSIDISEWLFYRMSRSDGVYGFLEFPYRPAGNSRISYLGNSPTVGCQWSISKKLNLTALYATEFVGYGFFQSEKPGRDLTYVGLGMTFSY